MQKNANIIGGLENSHLRNLVYGTDGVSPAIVAATGMGGGFVPLVIICHISDKQQKQA